LNYNDPNQPLEDVLGTTFTI